MPQFLLTWFVPAILLTIAAYIVPGFVFNSFVAAAIAAVVLGLVNALFKSQLAWSFAASGGLLG